MNRVYFLLGSIMTIAITTATIQSQDLERFKISDQDAKILRRFLEDEDYKPIHKAIKNADSAQLQIGLMGQRKVFDKLFDFKTSMVMAILSSLLEDYSKAYSYYDFALFRYSQMSDKEKGKLRKNLGIDLELLVEKKKRYGELTPSKIQILDLENKKLFKNVRLTCENYYNAHASISERLKNRASFLFNPEKTQIEVKRFGAWSQHLRIKLSKQFSVLDSSMYIRPRIDSFANVFTSSILAELEMQKQPFLDSIRMIGSISIGYKEFYGKMPLKYRGEFDAPIFMSPYYYNRQKNWMNLDTSSLIKASPLIREYTAYLTARSITENIKKSLNDIIDKQEINLMYDIASQNMSKDKMSITLEYNVYNLYLTQYKKLEKLSSTFENHRLKITPSK